MNKQKILLRVNAGQSIGFGHLSRCIALAELLRDDFDIVFAIHEPDSYVFNELRRVADTVIPLPLPQSDSDFNNELTPYLLGNEIVVLDGYAFTTEYERIIKRSAAALITVDDVLCRHYAADVVLNFCGLANPNDYSKEFYTQLHIGLDFVFLRSPFLRTHADKQIISERLLLNMGGVDSGNETKKILEEILNSGFEGEIIVIVGRNYPFQDSLKPFIDENSSVFIKVGLSAIEMHETMLKCTLAVLPPSTVALEFLSTGGVLFIKQTSDNQRCLKKYLIEKEEAIEYSQFSEYMHKKDFKLKLKDVSPYFDGSSLHRVKKLFFSLSRLLEMKFRNAAQDDATLVFNWVTDPEVRKYSFSNDEIKMEHHLKWFNLKIKNKFCQYFIVEINHAPIGQIRFDALEEEQDTYLISYLISKEYRGQGLGTSFLIKGIMNLRSVRPVKKVIGYVQDLNSSSLKVFGKAGFEKKIDLKYPNSSKFELSFTN